MAGSLSCAKSNISVPLREYSEKSSKKGSQVEVHDRSRICPDQWQRTRGTSCVQNYTVCKHGWTHDSLDMNAKESEHESTRVSSMLKSLDMNARKNVMRSWSDFRTFMSRPPCVHPRLLCVHQTEKIYLLGCSEGPEYEARGYQSCTNI